MFLQDGEFHEFISQSEFFGENKGDIDSRKT